jgi:hypothetical protein
VPDRSTRSTSAIKSSINVPMYIPAVHFSNPLRNGEAVFKTAPEDSS